MKPLYKLSLIALQLASLTGFAQTRPLPYSGTDCTDQTTGNNLYRSGYVVTVPNKIYTATAFDEWKKTRGLVNPATVKGLVSNPFRADGIALGRGYCIPANFSGYVPIYTFGNNWPFLGPNQQVQKPCNLCSDCGIYLSNGIQKNLSDPLIIPGGTGITVVNNTPYSIVISSGSFPGNEQPGQVITPLNPGDSAPMPLPPPGWLVANGQSHGPEMYVSVAGLHPLDLNVWHYSSWSPDVYANGNVAKDYGTPGFAYNFSSTFYAGNNFKTIIGGVSTNEGYDPIVSGDPGYGVAFYVDGILNATMDIQQNPNNPYQALEELVALSSLNPGIENTNAIYLHSNPAYPTTSKGLYKLIPHAAAQSLIASMKNQTNWKYISITALSNTSAMVKDVALPQVVPGTFPTGFLTTDHVSGFSITPSMTQGDITVNTSAAGTFQIMDTNGRLLFSQSTNETGKLLVDLGMYQNGIYIARFTSAHEVLTQRIVKL